MNNKQPMKTKEKYRSEFWTGFVLLPLAIAISSFFKSGNPIGDIVYLAIFLVLIKTLLLMAKSTSGVYELNTGKQIPVNVFTLFLGLSYIFWPIVPMVCYLLANRAGIKQIGRMKQELDETANIKSARQARKMDQPQLLSDLLSDSKKLISSIKWCDIRRNENEYERFNDYLEKMENSLEKLSESKDWWNDKNTREIRDSFVFEIIKKAKIIDDADVFLNLLKQLRQIVYSLEAKNRLNDQIAKFEAEV